MSRRTICFYSPANLNNMDGSAIWIQAVAETLHVDPDLEITLPLRAMERRTTITGLLRRLDRVELLDPRALGRRGDVLDEDEALDAIEALDRRRHFDGILLRSFALCLAAAARPALGGRLLSAYILEPERDTSSAAYRAEMGVIAEASRYVVSQSEEMRALTESLVPAARGKTILLPPAIPAEPVRRPDPDRIVRRMLYAGKFHPFYPVGRMVEFLRELRLELPDLEFHVVGDKIFRPPDDPGYHHVLRHSLSRTPGVVWHGAIPRDAVEALLADGGVALSLWDYRHGSTMNDLVISTKLLDYASVGIPVILMRTAAQEALLGPDYPLFVSHADEALPLLRRLFHDAGLYREASERTYAGSRPFTYPNVHARLAPFLSGTALDLPATGPAALALADRPKLAGARFNLGIASLGPTALDAALALLRELNTADERFRLIVRPPQLTPDGEAAARAALAAAIARSGAPAASVTLEPPWIDGDASWLRMVGFLVLDTPPTATPAELRPFVAAGLASGAPPVVPGADAPAEGAEWLGGSPAALAAVMRDLVVSGGWAGAAARARAAAAPLAAPPPGVGG